MGRGLSITMIDRLYKVKISRQDGLYGRFYCIDGQSQWLTKRDADACIASSIGDRCNGVTAPYYAVLKMESEFPHLPENVAYGNWEMPKGKVFLSDEATQEGKLTPKPRIVERKKVWSDPKDTASTVS